MTNSNVKQQEQIWTRFSEAQKSVMTDLLKDVPCMTLEQMMHAEYKIVGDDE